MACDPEDICEECPEWIFTLADLLMCMMGLFVILWVLKPDVKDSAEETVQEEMRVAEIIHEINLAFGAAPEVEEAHEVKMAELLRKLDQIRRNGEGEKGNAVVASRGADGTESEVTTIRDGELAGLGGRATFDAGDASLGDEQRAALRQIAGKIRGHRNVVLVKGHTGLDDVNASGAAGRDAHLDLSLARARAVADFLIEQGVSGEILRLQASGPYEPIKLRAYDAADRRTNRRVEIEATDQLLAARADAPAEVDKDPVVAPIEDAPATPAPHH